MIDNALDLLFLLLLALWAAGVGQVVLRAFGLTCRGVVEHLAQSVPLGLGMLSLSVLALGLMGLLTFATIAGVLIAGIAACAWSASKRMSSAGEATRPYELNLEQAGRIVTVCMAGALALTLTATLLSSLAPVTDGDALCYHLQVPKVFLARNAAVFEPDLHETVYPLVTEMIYAVALAVRGPVACRLVQWLLGGVFAACTVMLARPALGRQAFWAGTIAVLVPAISNGMAAPLNDVALATYCAATLVAFMGWWETPAVRNAAMAGILAGLALGVKYPAIVWVALLASAWAVRALLVPGARRARIQQLATFTLTAIAVGGIWYARAYFCTGNPVFPYFKHVFGGAGLNEVLEPAKRPLAVTPWNLFVSLWPVTLDPDRFDSVSHQLGPLFLMLLPAVFVMRAPRRVVAMVLLGLAFYWLCMTQRQSMRFMLPAVGAWSVGVGWVMWKLVKSRQLLARVCVGIVVGFLLFQTAIAVAHVRRVLPLLTGHESREAFLARCEPSYSFGRWAGERLPASSRIIGQDHRGFYIPRPYTMELAHRRRTRLGLCGESAAQVIATLRARGYTHLLLCPPVPEDSVEFDPTLGRLLAPWIAAHVPLFDKSLADDDGIVRRYMLYELVEPTAMAQVRR